MSEPEEIRIQLARMEGKQDVTNERLNNVQTDITDLRRVTHGHSNRLQVLEADKYQRDGERKGFVGAGRIAWMIGGLIGGGSIVALLKAAFGL